MASFNSNNGNSHERRRYPRYYVSSRLTLAIEDESLKESLGIGEPQDISLGGLRVTNLPACPNVKVGDQLGLLLLDGEDALSLTGEVVHHAIVSEARSWSPFLVRLPVIVILDARRQLVYHANHEPSTTLVYPGGASGSHSAPRTARQGLSPSSRTGGLFLPPTTRRQDHHL